MAPISILFVGPSGAGKSSSINSLAYLGAYKTFDGAVRGPPIALIPTKFLLSSDLYDHQHEIEVRFQGAEASRNDNERMKTGHSETKRCTIYDFAFDFGDGRPRDLKIVDTPGVLDTEGTGQDSANIGLAISTLRDSGIMLHGVVIVIKATENRLNPAFRYFLSKLLSLLHVDAKDNVVFLVTHCDTSKGDQARASVRTFLKDLENEKGIKDRGIKFNLADSFFRIENGFYQYIHARHAGMMFTEEEEAAFESAWKISRAQIRQLIDRISSFLPFDTQQMVKLHEQRQLLRHLTQPLVEAQEQIERTKKEIERHNADLRTLDKGISDYKAKLYTPVDKWEEQRVNRPQTVCENCKRMVDGRVVFDRVCHYDCQISHVTEYQPGHPSLQYCATFDCGKSERCNEPWCGHTLGSHMHIPFIYRKYTAKVIDDNVQQMLNGKYSKKQVVEAQIRTNEKVSKQLDSEMSVIRKINLELVGEIGGASIDPFSDATEKYLETCISNAESQNDKKALERHQQELQEHRQMRNLYVQSLESGGNGNTVDVEKAVQELFGLEHLGQFIKRSYQKYLDAEKEKATYAQVRFEPSKGLGDLLRNLGWRTPSADSEPAIVHRMRPVLDEPTETNV